MSDIRLQIRIKSSRIMRAMERAGYYSVAELCRSMGIPRQQSTIGYLVNMKESPLQKDGAWRPLAMELATALHVEPDALWPEYLRYVELKKNEVSVDVTMDEFETLASNPDHLTRTLAVRDALAQLPDRLKRVLELRYGFGGNGAHTLEEAAHMIKSSTGGAGVTRERVRQMENKALRRLRELSAAKRLGLSPDDIS